MQHALSPLSDTITTHRYDEMEGAKLPFVEEQSNDSTWSKASPRSVQINVCIIDRHGKSCQSAYGPIAVVQRTQGNRPPEVTAQRRAVGFNDGFLALELQRWCPQVLQANPQGAEVIVPTDTH